MQAGLICKELLLTDAARDGRDHGQALFLKLRPPQLDLLFKASLNDRLAFLSF